MYMNSYSLTQNYNQYMYVFMEENIRGINEAGIFKLFLKFTDKKSVFEIKTSEAFSIGHSPIQNEYCREIFKLHNVFLFPKLFVFN